MPRKKTKTDSESKNEYNRRNYDSFLLTVPRGAKEQLKALAAANGQSLNRYILEAVESRSGLKLTLDNGLPWLNSENKN